MGNETEAHAFIVCIDLPGRRGDLTTYKLLSDKLNGESRGEDPRPPIFSEAIPRAGGAFPLPPGQYFVTRNSTADKLLAAAKLATEDLSKGWDIQTKEPISNSYSVIVIEIADPEASITWITR
jgi:hypothetical protein